MVEMKLPASSPVSGPLRLDVDGHHEVPNDGILTGYLNRIPNSGH